MIHKAKNDSYLTTQCGLVRDPSDDMVITKLNDRVTCPSCLTAMPSPVEVGHAWRVGGKLGRTLYRDGECVGIVDTKELAEQIVAALGTVPALAPGQSTPVETPPVEPFDEHDHRACDPCATGPQTMPRPNGCQCHQEAGDSPCRVHGDDDAAAPAPSEPVKPRMVPCRWCGDLFDPGMNPNAELCSAACGVEQRDAAAPALGVGERELTLAEAFAAAASGKELEYQVRGGGMWLTSTELVAGHALAMGQLAELTKNRYRLKPEPLPAPAPRVSRLAEIVDEWCDQAVPEPMDLARDVAREALVCVRRHLAPFDSGIATALDAAELEMTGESRQ